MKRTTSLFLFHFPYRHNLNPYSVSFEGLPLGESDDFTLFAACNGGGSCQASYIEDGSFGVPCCSRRLIVSPNNDDFPQQRMPITVTMRFPSNGSWVLLSCKAKGNSSWCKEMID